MSVCGTDGLCLNALGLFLSVLSQESVSRRKPFIPGLLDLLDGYNHEPALAIMPRIQEQTHAGTGILTRCPSPTLIRLGLGPTNPGMITIAQETLLFRWAGFSPALKLLIPAFSLDNAPPYLAVQLHCDINAPLPHK